MESSCDLVGGDVNIASIVLSFCALESEQALVHFVRSVGATCTAELRPYFIFESDRDECRDEDDQ